MVKKNQDMINDIVYSINKKRNYQNYAQREYSDEEWEELYASYSKKQRANSQKNFFPK